jgi:hypothetical protein
MNMLGYLYFEAISDGMLSMLSSSKDPS